MLTKETIANFSVLEARFNRFTDIETIDKLLNLYMPKIEKLSNNLDEYERQNTDTQECVKQLDRNLSLKCNKSGLTKLEGDLIKAMIPKAELPIIEKKMKDIRQITEDQD